jgi:hypothetical protein
MANELSEEYNNLLSKVIIEGVDTSIIEDLGESVIDSGITDNFLESIPIVKIGKSIVNMGKGFHEIHYIKKFLAFFAPMQKKKNSKERQAFIEKLSVNKKLRDRVFERILISIDKIDETEKSKILGILFLGVINDRLSINEYLRMTWVVEKLRHDDLKYFIITNRKFHGTPEMRKYEAEYYSSIGDDYNNQEIYRVGLKSESVKVKKARYDGGSEFEKEYTLTTLGHNFLEIYWSLA